MFHGLNYKKLNLKKSVCQVKGTEGDIIMGFLDLFNRKKPAQTSPVEFPERAPRVTLVPLHHIYFDLQEPISCSGIMIANISASGVGFFKDKLKDWPTPGTILSGNLMLQEKIKEVTMTIVRNGSDVVGCHFNETSGDLHVLIDQYFQVELSAMQLGKVDQQYVKKTQNGHVNWYRGSDNCELYTITSKDKIVSFNLSFFGNYIEFDHNTTLKFGKISSEDNDSVHYKGTDLISQQVSIPVEIAESSIKFINNIKELKAEHRIFIGTIIKKYIDTVQID